jgi:hypothetical protein
VADVVRNDRERGAVWQCPAFVCGVLESVDDVVESGTDMRRVSSVVTLGAADGAGVEQRGRGRGDFAAHFVEVVGAPAGFPPVVVGGDVVLGRSGVEEAGFFSDSEALAFAVALAQGRTEWDCVGVGVDGIGWQAGGVVARPRVVKGILSTHLGRGRPNGEEEGSKSEGLHGGLEVEGRFLVLGSRRQEVVFRFKEVHSSFHVAFVLLLIQDCPA